MRMRLRLRRADKRPRQDHLKVGAAAMTYSQPYVLCVGILVADLFVPPLAALPEAGRLVATEDFLMDSGGCAANTSTTLARLGIEARVAGKVGEDSYGAFITQDLARKGVEISGVSISRRFGTSKTVILPVIGEDRRFIHTFGANADFGAADIKQETLAGASVFYVGGYMVLPDLAQDDLAALFQLARLHGVRTALDVVVPAGDTSASLGDLERVLPFVDVFLPNDEEAQHLTGEGEPRRQAEAFLHAGCATVVITRGGRGALLMDQTRVIEAPAFDVALVDASGAGDAFAGGFIAGMMIGLDQAETLRFASAIGASCCTHLGCTTGIFTREQADAFLREHPLPLRIDPR
jgi:sugar/nucleoside kinase (ribokinase family)